MVAVDIPEQLIGIERRIQAPVTLPLWVECLAGFDTSVQVAGEHKSMRCAIGPAHDSLDDAMKAGQLGEGRHMNTPPSAWNFDF